MECGICFVSADNKNIYALQSMIWQRQFENVFVFHFRVNPTNDSINRVIPTDNSAYLYKYAFSSVQQS